MRKKLTDEISKIGVEREGASAKDLGENLGHGQVIVRGAACKGPRLPSDSHLAKSSWGLFPPHLQ